MGRARVFAAPFVVTAALGGCEQKTKEPEPEPERPPRVAPDARAMAQVIPDAAPLPEAPDGAIVISRNGECRVLSQGARVACPPAGAALAFGPHPSSGRAFYDEWSGRCMEEPHVDCPPPSVATCNPPAPVEVPCPPGLLPALNGAHEVTRRDGDRCFWKPGDREYEVTCPPPPPPKAPKGALVYLSAGVCYTPEDTYDTIEVECPKSGPTITVPEHDAVLVGNLRVYLREPELACYGAVDGACPPPPPGTGRSCNPPPPRPVECPPELMPILREDLEPERKDGKCWHGAIQVRCP